jgi:hypothetical protein
VAVIFPQAGLKDHRGGRHELSGGA